MNVNSNKSLKLPILKCILSHHVGRGKNERITRCKNWNIWCVHKMCPQNTSRRNNHQDLSPSRSRSWRWSWTFCSVNMAHAIWARKGIYGVIWPFDFKSFRITVRPHIQHVSLEALPTVKKRKYKKNQCLFLFNDEHSKQPNMSSPCQFFLQSFSFSTTCNAGSKSNSQMLTVKQYDEFILDFQIIKEHC